MTACIPQSIRAFHVAVVLAMLTACGAGINNLDVKMAKETSAEHCEERGRCVKNPAGLVAYNPELVTDTLVVKQEVSSALLTRVINLVAEPRLLLISEKIEPLIRGISVVGELEPCESPRGIDGSNPTAGTLRQLKEGRYKTCLVYMGEGYLKRVMALEPISVDKKPPDVAGGVSVSEVSPNSGVISWSKAGDNVTLDGELSYIVYLSTNHAFTSLEDVHSFGNPLPGKIVGLTSYAMRSLAEKTLYHAAVIVRDDAGNESLVGTASFTTPALDVTAPTVDITSNRDPGPTNIKLIYLTIKFSETVSGFDTSDVEIVGGTKGDFTANDGSTYTLAVTATGSPVSATIPANAAEDASGNKSLASSAWSLVINGAAAATVASPAAGVYTSATSVSLSTSTAGATIYYTLDNSTPTVASSLYTNSINVNSSQTIKTLVKAPNYDDSAVTSHVFTITGTVQTPTFSVSAGAYGPAQTVTLASATPGASIYYTTNGSDPTTASTQYSGAITVSTSQTIKAFAVLTDWLNSSVASAAYVINGPVATPAFSVSEGAYGPAQSVTLNCATAGATIYYTTNGEDPTTSSTVYSSAISVSSSMTIKALATKTGFSNSSIATAAYTINGAVATPTFSVAAGTYTSAQLVTLSTTTTQATIYYTTNGTNPTTTSSVYSSAINVSSSKTIKAFAVKANYTNSSVASAAYTINLPPPEALISTPAHLAAVANCLSCNYRVTANLDMTGQTWTPIDQFTGTFDGGGYTISNISLNTSAAYSGLFGRIAAGAVVRNVHTRNISITSSGTFAGGIAGHIANGALLMDSSSTGSVTLSTTDTSTANVGGLVAGVDGIVRRSWSSANVSTTGYDYCHSGGAFGWIGSTATVSEIYATGTAYSTCTIGNIASGGLIGTCLGKIINSYSSGASDNINMSHNEGGMVGFVSGCTSTSSYWNTTTSGRATSRTGTGLSDTDMKTQSNFSGWDFTVLWQMNGGDGVGMPVFKSNPTLNGPASILVSSNSGTSATLGIYAPTATEMYITNTAGCGAGGTWEAKSSTKSWTLSDAGDGTGTVYAKFRNGSGVSNCVSHRVSVTTTALDSEGSSCFSIRSIGPGRMSGVYLIDPDGAGTLTAENQFCNMDYTGGGWTLITRTFADNADIPNQIPSTAEYLSLTTVGSLTVHKYILGNNRQGFATWGAVGNGVGLNPVSDFNGNLQKYTSYVGGSTARPCNWQGGSGAFTIATTNDGACLSYGSGANSMWGGTTDGSVYATLVFQGSTYNLWSGTAFPPLNIVILDGADNDYCSIMQNGTSTFGNGYTCRSAFLGASAVTQSDYIEVYAK